MAENGEKNEELVVLNEAGGITTMDVSENAAFGSSLKRNNAAIKKDRADEITREAFIRFKRSVEDLEEELYRLIRRRNNMLDLSPTSVQSLMPAKDFDAGQYLLDDIKLSKEIREKTIIANITRKRCNYLFGTDYKQIALEE